MDSVGVIVATYGDKVAWDWLAEKALASVRAQTCPPKALVRIHGNSLHEARNQGAEQCADCPWIIVLDADDELDPRYIEAMLAGSPGDVKVPHIQRVRDGVSGAVGLMKIPAGSIFERNYVPIGAMIRREWFLKVGGFEDWPIYEDWCLWMRLEKAGAVFTICPEAVYRIHWRRGSRNDQVELRAPTLAKIRADISARSF